MQEWSFLSCNIWMRAIYRKAINAGLSKSDLKRLKLTAQICFVAFVGSILVTILDLLQQKWTNSLVDVFTFFIYLSTFFFLRDGKFILGKSMIFIGVNILLGINASREGPDAGNQFIFLPLIVGPLILFSRSERKYAFSIWILCLTTFAFLEITDYSLFLYSSEVNKGLLYVNYLFCFFLSLVLLVVFILNYDAINRYSEKRLEKLNHRLKKNNLNLQKANSELDSFVYKASHDLRSPLTSLMGLIELIKNEKDPEVMNYYLSLEEKTVNRLDTYISDILNISRNSRLPLKRENVNIEELCGVIFNQMNFMDNSEKIKKKVIVEGGDFFSDSMRLTILLNNLISNAIRYCDMSKPYQFIVINTDITDKHCSIRVWDNGIGIKKDYLDKIYNMFFRATVSRSGSGLGLYIVKETVDKLNGSIQVNSEIGQWTEFIVRIPNMK